MICAHKLLAVCRHASLTEEGVAATPRSTSIVPETAEEGEGEGDSAAVEGEGAASEGAAEGEGEAAAEGEGLSLIHI